MCRLIALSLPAYLLLDPLILLSSTALRLLHVRQSPPSYNSRRTLLALARYKITLISITQYEISRDCPHRAHLNRSRLTYSAYRRQHRKSRRSRPSWSTVRHFIVSRLNKRHLLTSIAPPAVAGFPLSNARSRISAIPLSNAQDFMARMDRDLHASPSAPRVKVKWPLPQAQLPVSMQLLPKPPQLRL